MSEVPLDQIAAARRSVQSKEASILHPAGQKPDTQAGGDQAAHAAEQIEGIHKDARKDKVKHDVCVMDNRQQEHDKPVSEKAKDAIATADQDITTGLRDATHAAAEGLSAAGSKVAEGAAAVYEGAKDAAHGAADAVAGGKSDATAAAASGGSEEEVLVEVGDTVEFVKRSDLETGVPATDQMLTKEKRGADMGHSAGSKPAE